MNDVLVSLDRVWVSYNSRIVLEDVSLKLGPGQLIGVVGPNGAGKTTLLKTIIGLLRPSRGAVSVLGQNPTHSTAVRRAIGYLPQRSRFSSGFPVSVRDVISMGLLGRSRSWSLRSQTTMVLEAAEAVGLLSEIHAPIGELSGGQQQRALLARALVSKPSVLLLDEPTAGLDLSAQAQFYELLKTIQSSSGVGILAVSHDIAAITYVANLVVCVNRTAHIHERPFAELLQNYRRGYRCEYEAFIEPWDRYGG
ncbi:MAG: ABC transporter ATP-binding protein [Bacillota bacterium]